MLRKIVILSTLTAALGQVPVSATVAEKALSVSKDANCGCCNAWIDHMQQHKFEVKSQNLNFQALAEYKLQRSIPSELQSCHTAEIDGYSIEGHVPAEAVDRLLAERPDAVGLTVPGMPLGSPGMDFGSRVDPYDVLLIKHDGTTEVFASYPAN